MKSISRALTLAGRYCHISLCRLTVFNFDMMFLMISMFLRFAFVWIFWWTMAQNSMQLGEWGLPQLLVLAGMGMISSGVTEIAFPFRDLADDVVSGNLDLWLCRPVGIVASIIGNRINLSIIFVFVLQGIIITVAALTYFHLAVTWQQICMSVAVMLAGCVSNMFIYALMSLTPLWFDKNGQTRHMFYQVTGTLTRYPATMFPKILQRVMVTVLPIAFLGTAPTMIMLGMTDLGWMLLGIAAVAAAAWGIGFRVLLRVALKRYESWGG